MSLPCMRMEDFPPVSPIMRMRNIKASYTSLCLKLLRTEEMLLNYMKLADSVAAAVQEVIATDGDVQEIFTRYQDEYNARYAGE